MVIAKIDPKESLAEHTQELLIRLEKLKDAYGSAIKDPDIWKLLYLAAKYHDTGKAYTHFQNRMKKLLGQEVKNSDLIHIPHNYLSPFFLPLRSLRLNKYDRRVLIEAIAYHHERNQVFEAEQVRQVAEEDLIQQFSKVKKDFEAIGEKIELPQDNSTFNYIEADLSRPRFKYHPEDEQAIKYVLVKGLLHRLDHAASAGVEIELDHDFCLTKMTETYLQEVTKKEEGYLRPLQAFAKEHQDKNLILIAQTGMGKTEAALLWAGRDKTFFTVPLRVSLNALYNRVSQSMGYENCGLLHSSSAHHLSDTGEENWEVIYDHSRYLANKLTFTTIDQIAKFPFKFKGYEKYLATFAYSTLIIDEIQAYSPWIVAVIIKALEMIRSVGGKFMIITATLPQIYVDALKEKQLIDENTIVKTFTDDRMIRHRMNVIEDSIFSSIDNILEAGQREKVLVIVNTVDQAIKLYEEMKSREETSYIKLLHARFVQKDRQRLEKELEGFANDSSATGIWITTQIVEASMDIDFDKLYTELSPLDSLFQRFGRCYRKREYDSEEANIFIYTEEVSGRSTVYDSDILNFSKDMLTQHIKEEGTVVLESVKIQLVKTLYSKETLKGTKYYQEFRRALQQLNLEDYILTHREAQTQLRGDDSAVVIPRNIFDQTIPLFEALEVEEDKKKRTALRREIEAYTCSVMKGSFKKYLSPIDFYRKTKYGNYPVMENVFILDRPYEFDEVDLSGRGILKEEGLENIFL